MVKYIISSIRVLIFKLLRVGTFYIGKTDHKGFENHIKIGKTRRCVNQRWKEIDRSVPRSTERPILNVRVIFIDWFENQIKALLLPFKSEFKGSGRTEWYLMPLWRRTQVVFIAHVYSLFSRILILFSYVGVIYALKVWIIKIYPLVLQYIKS